jgi:hypothetical protein
MLCLAIVVHDNIPVVVRFPYKLVPYKLVAETGSCCALPLYLVLIFLWKPCQACITFPLMKHFVPILLYVYCILLTANVVASFRLQRMISELSGNKSKLEYDIFEEIGINNSTVCFTSFFIHSNCPCISLFIYSSVTPGVCTFLGSNW